MAWQPLHKFILSKSIDELTLEEDALLATLPKRLQTWSTQNIEKAKIKTRLANRMIER